MVETQLRTRGISDTAVLEAISKVPRHLFVEPRHLSSAYDDCALPIKENQTISQPYIVALMTEIAQVKSNQTVLEIGTGSGYQSAILSRIVKQVYSIEIVESLAKEVRNRLKVFECDNVETRHGDGYHGWPEGAPFDAILITAAASKVPEPLIDQLKIGGRMVLPLGELDRTQELMVLTKQPKEQLQKTFKGRVIFVPMTGAIGKSE